MPIDVQRWLESGHSIPISFDGKDTRVFVNKLHHKHATESVLLVPDVHTSSFSYRHVFSMLHKQGYNVITFDFPGFGLSKSAPAGYKHTDDQAQGLILRVMNSMNLRSVHLVLQGTSAQAGVALAQKNRPRVRSLILSGVDARGVGAFSTPPLFDSSFGYTVATQVVGAKALTLSWFGSSAATNFSSDLLHAYAYLVNFNGGKPTYLKALRAVEKLRIHNAPQPCTGDHGDGGHSHDHTHDDTQGDGDGSAPSPFASAVVSLSVRCMTLWVDAGGQVQSSDTTVGHDSAINFAVEQAPLAFSQHVATFVAALVRLSLSLPPPPPPSPSPHTHTHTTHTPARLHLPYCTRMSSDGHVVVL